MKEGKIENLGSIENELKPKKILELVKKYEASGVDSGVVDRTVRIDTKMKLTEPMIKVLEGIVFLENGSWEFDPQEIAVIIENLAKLRSDIEKIKNEDKIEKSCAEDFANFFDNQDKISTALEKANVQAD
jgi:hypothetical protein